MAGVLGVPALFFHPVYHHFGFPGTLAPLMGCWFVFYVASMARDPAINLRQVAPTLGWIALGLLIFLQPFAASITADDSIFKSWHALIPGWDNRNLGYMSVVAILAQVVLFFPTRPSRPNLLLGLLLIGLLLVIHAQIWTPELPVRLGLIAILGTGWYGARHIGIPEMAAMLGIAALFMLNLSWIYLTPRNYLDTALMIGALMLCARVIRTFPQPENLRADYIVLALFGLIITGWASLSWSGKHLEWHAAYEYFSTVTVERNVAWFIPWIALKGLLPWVIILWGLHLRLSPWQRLPSHTIMALFMVKVLSLLMITVGLGGIDTHNHNYLETATVVAVIVGLYIGVILLPRAWPRQPPAP